jgi:hypothetical protein
MTYKIRVDSIETRGISNCHIDLVAPCHCLTDLHLLILCGVPIEITNQKNVNFLLVRTRSYNIHELGTILRGSRTYM